MNRKLRWYTETEAGLKAATELKAEIVNNRLGSDWALLPVVSADEERELRKKLKEYGIYPIGFNYFN